MRTVVRADVKRLNEKRHGSPYAGQTIWYDTLHQKEWRKCIRFGDRRNATRERWQRRSKIFAFAKLVRIAMRRVWKIDKFHFVCGGEKTGRVGRPIFACRDLTITHTHTHTDTNTVWVMRIHKYPQLRAKKWSIFEQLTSRSCTEMIRCPHADCTTGFCFINWLTLNWSIFVNYLTRHKLIVISFGNMTLSYWPADDHHK